MKAEGRYMDGHKKELEQIILNFSDISFTSSHLCPSCTLFPFVPLKTDFFFFALCTSKLQVKHSSLANMLEVYSLVASGPSWKWSQL